MDLKQCNLLDLMMKDMEFQNILYKPTTFWKKASQFVIDELTQKDMDDFRRYNACVGIFAPTYAHPLFIQNPKIFENTKKSLTDAIHDFRFNIKLSRLLSGELQAFSDYRVLIASNINTAPYTDLVSESKVGNPVEQFTFDGRNFSRSFLNYLLGLNFLKQHVDSSCIKTVLEIGGGFGTLGEILLGDTRNECFYINADIPPTSFVSSYYLKKVFGDQTIADYEILKDFEVLDIAKLKEKFKALNICSWQVPKLQGAIDLFVNFISFQEMEPAVVQNYCEHISKLNPKYILLRNIKEGKKKKEKEGELGVETPILGDDYDHFLPQYDLIATDDSIFGFRTEDNFHSQLRLYTQRIK